MLVSHSCLKECAVKLQHLILRHNDQVIVEEGRRITAKHIREMNKVGLTEVEVPEST